MENTTPFKIMSIYTILISTVSIINIKNDYLYNENDTLKI